MLPDSTFTFAIELDVVSFGQDKPLLSVEILEVTKLDLATGTVAEASKE